MVVGGAGLATAALAYHEFGNRPAHVAGLEAV